MVVMLCVDVVLLYVLEDLFMFMVCEIINDGCDVVGKLVIFG